MLMGDKTVTLVRYTGGEYDCTVIHGASVYGGSGIASDASGDTPQSAYTVRLPSCADELVPKPGDYIALDSVTEIESIKDLAESGYFRVVKVNDNRRGRLRHIRVIGK